MKKNKDKITFDKLSKGGDIYVMCSKTGALEKRSIVEYKDEKRFNNIGQLSHHEIIISYNQSGSSDAPGRIDLVTFKAYDSEVSTYRPDIGMHFYTDIEIAKKQSRAIKHKKIRSDGTGIHILHTAKIVRLSDVRKLIYEHYESAEIGEWIKKINLNANHFYVHNRVIDATLENLNNYRYAIHKAIEDKIFNIEFILLRLMDYGYLLPARYVIHEG